MCVVSHHFNMHFSDGIGCWVSFHMLICHLYIFHGEVSAKVFGPFKNWVVFPWVLKVPCIFWIMALYHRNLLWLFSLKLWTIFSFSWYYLSQNISFYFSEAHLLNYFLYGPYPKHHQYHQGNLSFLLRYLLEILFSFNIYICNPFWVNFCIMMILHVNDQLFQHHLLKKLSLLHYTAFAPLSNISWVYLQRSISGLFFLFCWSLCLLFANTTLSWLLKLS